MKNNQHYLFKCCIIRRKNETRFALQYYGKIIKKSFTELIKQKPYEKITVKELCENASINRATFYSHYDNVAALYDAIKNTFIQNIIKTVMELDNNDSISSFFLEICKYIKSNADACEIVFGKFADEQITKNYIELVREKYINLWKDAGCKDDEQIQKLFTYISYGSIAVIKEWFANGMYDEPQKIATFIEINAKTNLLIYINGN